MRTYLHLLLIGSILIFPLLFLFIQIAALGFDYKWILSLLYFIVPLLILFITKKYIFDALQTKKEKLELPSILIFLFFLIVFVTVRFILWDNAPVWVDEYAQMIETYYNKNPFIGAAHCQQPPLSFILTNIFLKIFGFSLTTARLLGFFPGLLMYFFTALWILSNKKYFHAIPLLLFFCFDNPLIFHQLEGRSIGLALYWVIPIAYTLWNYLETNKIGWQILLGICSWFLLMSVTLQPPLLLAFLVLSLLITWILNKNKTYLSATYPIIFSVIYFLPVQFLIFDHAKKYTIHQHSMNLSQAIHSFFESINNYYSFGIYPNSDMFIAVLILFTIYCLILNKKKIFLITLLISLLIFPLVFHVVFKLVLFTLLSDRYYDIWRICTLFLLLLISIPENKKIKIITSFSLTIIMTYMFSMSDQNFVTSYTRRTDWRQDWGVIYKHISHEKFKDHLFYIQGPCEPGEWCMNYFFNRKMYVHNYNLNSRIIEPKNQNELFFENNGLIDKALQGLEEKYSLIIPFFKYWDILNYNPIIDKSNPNFRAYKVGDFIFVEALRATSVENLLKFIIDNSPKSANYFQIPETLLRLYLRKNEIIKAKKLWEFISSFEDIPEYRNKNSRFDQKYQFLESKMKRFNL